jgi:hypothetical protein
MGLSWPIAAGNVCCPIGQVPTGNSQPQQVCVQPGAVAQLPQSQQSNVMNSPGLGVSTATVLAAITIQTSLAAGNLLACYDAVVAGCLLQAGNPASPVTLEGVWVNGQLVGGVPPALALATKACIEGGFTTCLSSNGALAVIAF